MQRPKNDFSIKKDRLRNPQLSPKLSAKRPINLRKKIMAGQASAHCANRNKTKQTPQLRVQEGGNRFEYLYRDKNTLTDEQVKQSAIYKLLEQEIKQMTIRQKCEIDKLKEIKAGKQKEVTVLKKQQHSVKLQIWELKNEAMELKQSIKDQREQSQRLMEELGIDGHNENEQEGHQIREGERETNDNEGQHSRGQPQSNLELEDRNEDRQ